MKKLIFNIGLFLAVIIPLGFLSAKFFFSLSAVPLKTVDSEKNAKSADVPVIEELQSPFAPTVVPLQDRVAGKPALENVELPESLPSLELEDEEFPPLPAENGAAEKVPAGASADEELIIENELPPAAPVEAQGKVSADVSAKAQQNVSANASVKSLDEISTDELTDVPAEISTDALTEIPAENSSNALDELPEEVPADVLPEAPATISADALAEAPAEAPAEVSAEISADVSLEMPENNAEDVLSLNDLPLSPTAETQETAPVAAEKETQTADEMQEKNESSKPRELGPDGLVLERPSRFGSDPTQKFDPVKENGEIFVGWEKPTVTLVLTGRLNGYMEPCGCAGMDRMMGGLSRQYEFFSQLKEQDWEPLILDVGGISPGVTKQAQLKFLSTVNMLREMGYDAITLGTIDLNFPCADIWAEVSNSGVSGKLFTSANVGLFEFNNKLLPPAKIVSRNGVKIGIVGVLGDEECEQVKKQNDEVVVRPAKLVLAKLIPLLKKQCQFIVLLSHATIEESKEYAKEFPDVDVIVTPNGPPVPPAEPEIIPETGQYFITIGEKGMNVLVLGLYDDDEMPLRYQRVPMDSRFPSSQKILDLMGIYQDQLQQEGLKGLGINPLRNPFEKSHGTYVGSKRCESCHEESFKVWKTSRHSIAWKSLEKSNPPRTFDPECIACHVEGWNAEHRMPFKSGFLNVEDTPDQINVGCESCHGPGEMHMQAEIGSNEKLQEKYRKALHLDATDVAKTKAICIQCHDLDNSPKFDYERYYKVIEHHEGE